MLFQSPLSSAYSFPCYNGLSPPLSPQVMVTCLVSLSGDNRHYERHPNYMNASMSMENKNVFFLMCGCDYGWEGSSGERIRIA